jgi:hypothetical protein
MSRHWWFGVWFGAMLLFVIELLCWIAFASNHEPGSVALWCALK